MWEKLINVSSYFLIFFPLFQQLLQFLPPTSYPQSPPLHHFPLPPIFSFSSSSPRPPHRNLLRSPSQPDAGCPAAAAGEGKKDSGATAGRLGVVFGGGGRERGSCEVGGGREGNLTTDRYRGVSGVGGEPTIEHHTTPTRTSTLNL